jgi:hypothetical protein
MSADKIFRFNPNGPKGNGLEGWDPIDPAGLEAGEPVQRGHIYHQESSYGYMAGVWDCTAMTEKFGPYGVNEFMYLLEGSVTMILEGGDEVTINAGEAFIIPKGLPCQWKQQGYVRKYFVIFENPGTPAADDVSSQGIILPKPSGPSEAMQPIAIDDAAVFVGEKPVQHNHTYFTAPGSQMICGLWDSTAFETPAIASPESELMIILEGAVTLTNKDGNNYLFKAGDTAYVPKGCVRSWKSSEYVRKFYCSFNAA